MADEIPPTASEETIQTPPATVPPVQAAPPPAAAVVIAGEKSERELELERRLEANERLIRDRETVISEREKEIQTLREIPAPPKPPKVKRERNWSDPVFSNEDENE